MPWSESQVNDFVAKLDAEALAHLGPASLDELPDLGSGGCAFVDDEIAVCWRDAGRAGPRALETGTIDERAGRGRNPVRHAVDRRIRILEDAPGARRFERLGALAVG